MYNNCVNNTTNNLNLITDATIKPTTTPTVVSTVVKPARHARSCHTKDCHDDNITNNSINKRYEHIDTNLCTELINYKKSNYVNKKWNAVKFKKENNLVILSQSNKPTIVLNANNKPMSCLLDSGSDRCLIRYSTLLKFDENPEITESNVIIKGVNGKSNVIGETELSIKIPECDQIFSCKALVLKDMNFAGHCLIGRDILNDAGAIIDFQANKLIIQGVPIPFCQTKDFIENKKAFHESDCLLALTCNKKLRLRNKLKEDRKREVRLEKKPYENDDKNNKEGNSNKINIVKTANVHCSSDIEIASSSISVIYGHANVSPGNYLLEKNIDSKRGIMIAESLINIDGSRRIPITITNLNTENIFIPEGTMIAKIVPLNEDDITEQYMICESMLAELSKNNSYKSCLNNNCDNSSITGNSDQNCMARTAGRGGGTISGLTEGHVCGTVTCNENCCCDNNSNVNLVARRAAESEVNKIYQVSNKVDQLGPHTDYKTRDDNIKSVKVDVKNKEKYYLQNKKGKFKVDYKKEDYLHSEKESKYNGHNEETVKIEDNKSSYEGKFNVFNLEDLKKESKYDVKDKINNKENYSFCSKSDRANQIENEINNINIKELKLGEDIDGETMGKFEKLIEEFRDIFSKPNETTGKTSIIKHNIKLKSPNAVVSVVPYRVPLKYQSLLDEELLKMKNAGLIRDSNSPFNSPVIVIKKKDGSIRPVIDYRQLNKNTIIDSFALPNINEILNSLGGAKVFSTLDLKSAFHHIELEEHCKKYTAFSVNNSKFEFCRTPFGLSTSPSVFMALMSRCLNNSLGRIAFCYIDDIVIFSKNFDQHLKDLREVFTKLKLANLKLKLEKCDFLKSKVNYLGHVITDRGITFENNNKLRDTPVPQNAKTLQQFLGLANYYRKFIPLFSSIASPLYKLLKKDAKFDWTDKCQIAFDLLKKHLSKDLCLNHPNYNKEFYLFTDASTTGVGAVLMQPDDNGDLRPLSFFSKTMSLTQTKYSPTKREALGLVLALQHYRYIITDYPVVVLTDHRPLVSLFKSKLPVDTALARWCLIAQSFQIDLKYFADKLNIVADAFSKFPLQVSVKDMRNSETLIEHKALDTTNDEDITDDIETCVYLNESSKTEKPLQNYLPKLEDVSWSLDELRDCQLKDDFCSVVIDQLRGKFSPDAKQIVRDLDKFLMLGDILYRRRNIDNNNLETINIVIPSSLLHKAINAVHYNIHCDHVHTLFKFRFRYFHPFENKYVKDFVSKCHVCKLVKGRLPKPIKLKQAPLPSRPFEIVSMDFVGPLITTDEGNKYILSIIDLFSRFCILEALPTKNSEDVIRTLRRVFNTFGYPTTLLSDNALEFTSAALNCFTNIYSVRKTEVLTYAAWSNGIVERNNAKITNLLKLYVNTMDHSWDTFLDTVANCINNTLNESLKETPAYVLFHYDTLPNLQRESLSTVYNYDSLEDVVKLREQEAAKILQIISNNLSDSILKSHLRINSKRKDRIINIGDRVFIKNQKKHKLDLNYIGPGIVEQSNNHKLSIRIGNKLFDKVNINNVLSLPS